MTEDEFTERIVNKLKRRLMPHRVEQRRSLLYELSFDDKGTLIKGVDPDGTPIRGAGRGFQQDILIFDKVPKVDTSVIPRVVAEVKFRVVTTHDVLVYVEKADRIRRVYPYVRYGFVLGGLDHIPGRVLRLGQRFDFIIALSNKLRSTELEKFCQLMEGEVENSDVLQKLLFSKRRRRFSSFQRHLAVAPE